MPKLKPNQFLIGNHLITERPLLFQTEMVKANLEDRKTQTRRGKGIESVIGVFERMGYIDGKTYAASFRDGAFLKLIPCPYGKPGDLLWVREAFASCDEIGLVSDLEMGIPGDPGYIYKADYTTSQDVKWKPSIHMPKDASRIWAMVEDVRVERLQDISEEDAIAEGINKIEDEAYKYDDTVGSYASACSAFRSLWVSINGEESLGSNPWVWVIKYRILSKAGRPTDEAILDNYLQITGKEATNV